MLTTWQNPYGPALARHARATRSDLLALEVDLNRVFLERSGAAAQGGGPHLRRYVEDLVDLANVWSAIALAGRVDVDPETMFVEGGRTLSPRRFRSAVRDSETVIQTLGHGQERTAIANALARAGDGDENLEAELLSAQITEQRYLSRFDPLSTAPIVLFALRLRAVVVDVRRIAWGIVLGAAAPLLAEGLISPT
jgi:vacuolar-type H+-ATPase subunit C/Vma6